MGCAVSLSIELFQFLTKRGYAQTDDVLTNVLGTILGYAGYAVFCRCKKKILAISQHS